jgi:hypothetical protein
MAFDLAIKRLQTITTTDQFDAYAASSLQAVTSKWTAPASILLGPAKAKWDLVESLFRFSLLFEHDLFRKPASTFRDHAPGVDGA